MTHPLKLNIVHEYLPGSIGRVAELHGNYYHQHWGFGLFFEAKVATELASFLKRYDDASDGIWLASLNDRVEGSIIIDGIEAEKRGAHLRWFILSDQLRHRGVGRKLINQAIAFCVSRGYARVYLWTFKGLDAARHLYESTGFKLMKEQRGVQWGTEVVEQCYELNLADAIRNGPLQ